MCKGITQMNTKLLATAALVVAAAVSAPAFAQNVGSVGAAVNYTDVDSKLFNGNGSSVVIDGSVAIPLSGAWTVTANGDVSISDNDLSDETVASGAVHLTTKIGDTVRVGGFTALSRPSNDTLWAVGAEAQKYLDKVTLTGLVAYGQSNDLDADLYSVRGEARYFVSDNFRLNAGAGWSRCSATSAASTWNTTWLDSGTFGRSFFSSAVAGPSTSGIVTDVSSVPGDGSCACATVVVSAHADTIAAAIRRRAPEPGMPGNARRRFANSFT